MKTLDFLFIYSHIATLCYLLKSNTAEGQTLVAVEQLCRAWIVPHCGLCQYAHTELVGSGWMIITYYQVDCPFGAFHSPGRCGCIVIGHCRVGLCSVEFFHCFINCLRLLKIIFMFIFYFTVKLNCPVTGFCQFVQ